MKWTTTKLKDLKKRKTILLEKFNVVSAQLSEVCTHPKRYNILKKYYQSNTLGNDGENVQTVSCGLCEKYLSEDIE